MKRFYKFLMPLVAIVAMAVPAKAQDVSAYTFATDTSATSWVTLSSSATAVTSIYDDDEASSVMNIGFTFTFAGASYTQWSCNSNGRIALGSTAVDEWWVNPFTPSYITDTRTVFPLIAALGMDNTMAGSGVWCKYEVVGEAPSRMLVIEYRTPSEYDEEGDLVNYQIQLEEGTNVVRFVYGATSATYFDDFQAGMASSTDDVITVSPSHTTITGPTSTVHSSWPGVYRYYEFTPPTSFCARVASVSVSALGPDFITLSWVDNNNSSWLVRIDSANATGVAQPVSDTFYTFSYLSPMTQYTVGVAAICSSGDTSAWRTVTTSTPCAFLDSIPYVYGFEDATTGSSSNATFAAPCWSRVIATGSSYYPYISSSSSYCHTGTRGLYWYGSSSYDHTIVLPGVDVDEFPINTLQLKFWAKNSSSSYHAQLEIGVMTDPNDISTFQQVGTVNVEGTNWAEYETFLSTYTGTGNFVAVRSHNPSSYWYAYFDDFTLDLLPACPHVAEVVVDSAATDALYASWTPAGTESSWLVYLNDSLVDVATSNAYTFTDLSLNTVYSVGVRALCDNGDTADVVTVNGRTLAGDPISTFPYSCGFEYDADNDVDQASDWVLENGTQANPWFVGTAVNNGGTKSLYISNTNGTTNNYNTGSISYTFAYATFSFDAGEYAYSYDWRANGESSFDFIRAAVVPATVEFTAGEYCGFNNTSGVPAGGMAIDGAYRLNGVSSWQTQVGTFTIANSGLYKVVFMWRNDGSGGTMPPAAIDNIQISRNTCPAPTGLVASYIGQDTIIVSWTAGGEETQWVVSDGVNPAVEVSDNNYTFDNLNANTLYNISVRGICGADDTSLVTTASIRTACGVINLPFAEDFTGMASSSYPDCWTRVMSGSYPYITTSYGNSIQFAGTAAVIAPHINAPLNQMIVSFDLRKEGSSSGSMTFGYTSDPVAASDMVVLQTIDPATTSTYYHYEYDLSLDTNLTNLDPDSVYYLVWRQSSTATNWYYWLDNVNIEQYNPCTKPQNFTCTSTQPDSVVVTWNAGDASSWELYVGPAGVPVNEDSAFAVNDSVYVFTNLQGGVAYNFYVRTDCGGAYSNWAGPLAVTPGQYIIGTSGSASISMCGGVIYDDGGATGQYSNSADFTLTVYPSHPDSMLTFQGWAYTESSIDYLRIYEGTSPNGTILWQTSTSSQLDNIPYTIVTSGPITLKWHTDGSVVYDGFELQIGCMAAPECSPVDNLTVRPTPTAALVTWQPGYYGTYSGATVEYKVDTVETWTALPAVTGTYAIITGLDASTNYNLRVTTDCEGFPGGVALANFSTSSYSCLVADSTGSRSVTVGTGSSTSSYFPTYSCYNYSLTEQVFTPTELGGAGNLVSLTMTPTSVVSANRNVEIYLGHVSTSTLSNFVYPSDLTLVYTGTTNLVANTPYTFTLDNSFSYNGSDNLLVLFRDMTGSYSCSNNWAVTSTTSGVSRYVYQDDAPYSLGYTGGSSSSDRANTTFGFLACQTYGTCAAPAVAVTEVTTTTATVAWAPGNGETSWNLSYRMVGDANWSAPVAVTGNTYTVSGLTQGRKYEFRVENTCTEGNFAGTAQATLLCAQISDLPFTENFNGWGTGVTPNCWSNAGSYTPTSYGVISGTYNHSGSTGGSVYMYSSSTLSNKTYLTLPELDTLTYQPNQLQLVFSLFYTSTSYGRPAIEVGVMSDPNNPGSFVVVDTVQHSGALSTWEVFEVPMSGYTGNGSYVAMRTAFDSAYSYFYLDDLTLEVIPTCPRPDSLTASNATTTTIDLGWHERGGASQWIVEYGPRGFQLGTGTTVTANSNPFTLTGLPSSFQGEYYVKSICAVGDTGEYSRMGCAFGTTQVPATLPYNYDFENVAEWNNWQTSTNHETNNWYRGNSVADSGSYSMYVAAGDTASYFNYAFNAVVNAAAYRDIDFGPVDSSYTLSFRARVGGTTTAAYDGLMVFLVDPSIATVASTANITSPWGNVNDLYRIASVRLDTNWTTYEASFDTISGIHRVAFFWFNQNTGASYTNIPQPAAVDNIHIAYSTCPRPLNLEAVSTGSNAATLTWTGAAGADYEVVYRQVGGTNQTAIAHTNSITLTGLASTSEYLAWVRKICGAGDSSLYSDGTSFNTTMCDGAVTVATGDPSTATGTTYYAPVNNYYNYTLSETIIDSAELGGAMNITSLAYYYDYSTASTSKNNVTIWLQPTTKSSFSGSTDIVALDTNTAVQVYSGSLNCSEGWNYFAFTTDYSYSGTGNVLVIVDDNSGDYDGSSYVFASQSTTDYKTIVYYSDTYNPDLNTITSSSSYSGTKAYYQYRPVMQLISCGGQVACDGPANVTATATETTATVAFVAEPGAHEVAIAEIWDDATVTPISVSDTFYTFSGLTASTTYTIGVRNVCSPTNMSDWVLTTVTTDEHPCAVPTNLAFSDVTLTGATLSWTPGEAETQWEIHVTGTNYDQTFTTTTNPYTLTGLASGVEYTATVRALCSETAQSEWSNPVTFTTATCQPVSNVTVDNRTTTTAQVHWTAPAGVSNFDLEYGASGFAQGSGTHATATTNSITLSGLTPGTMYDVYVRSACGDNVYSSWSNAVSFETEEQGGPQGIEDIANANIALYPNPATTTVTLTGISGQATVTVVDMNGRAMGEYTANDNTLTIDLTGYAQGAYFVRITGEQVNAIRKLIVK